MPKLEAEVVICGAGIAGIAVAYELAVRHGVKDVVLLEQSAPLSLTSDKSTECYRNWWPVKPGDAGTHGPDGAMIALMNRSIERLEQIAQQSDNRIGLNRRGYLYATAEAGKVPLLLEAAQNAARMGAGPLRLHDGKGEGYVPAPAHGFEGQPDGADLITDRALIRRHFPYLAEDTVAVLHVRRAGWLSAQQLGMWMLEQSRDHGVRLVQGCLTAVHTTAGQVSAVEAEREDGSAFSIRTPCLVNAAGPMQKAVGRMMGVEIPVFAELHLKMSFAEHLGVVPREAPLLIWMDEVRLPWSPQEREMLAEEPSMRWLLEPLPPGVHCRPDGHGESHTLIVLYNHHLEPLEPRFPLPTDPHYADVALRGMSVMVPGLRRYFDKAPKPYIDGGYYVKTRENRPLIGPLPVKGAYLVGALSGFGVMAACAAGELLAAHILGRPLPEYAPAFALERYQDPNYLQALERFGNGAQL